jgi:phospholipase/carboxylesterase
MPQRPDDAGKSGGAGKDFLLVLCHGVESDAGQMLEFADIVQAIVPGASVFLPDAPNRCRRRVFWSRGRQWWSLKLSARQQEAAASRAADRLNRRVDAELARRGLPEDAVIFCGFSQGAMVALLAGLARPSARGIVSIAGALLAPQGALLARGRPPVLLIHGAADERVPAEKSEQAALRLRAAGIDARLRLLPSLGHWVLPDAAPAAVGFISEVCA